MNEFFPVLSDFPLHLVFKIPFLLLILIFVIFMFIALVQVKSLNRLITIHAHAESAIIQLVFFIYFLVTVSLFVIALAIL